MEGLRKLRNFFQDNCISQEEMLVLSIINENPAIRMADIKEKVDRVPSSITVIADKLEKLKLLKRQHCNQDRRSVRVKITKEGIELLDKFKNEFPNLG